MVINHAQQPTESILFDAIRAYVACLYGPSRRAKRVYLVLDDDERLSLLVPVPWQVEQTPGPRHSSDFRSVNWYGQRYTFSAAQAAVVRLLWDAWRNDTPEVGQETLLEASGSEGNKVSDLFRDHPAGGQLVVPGGSRGSYRLVEPVPSSLSSCDDSNLAAGSPCGPVPDAIRAVLGAVPAPIKSTTLALKAGQDPESSHYRGVLRRLVRAGELVKVNGRYWLASRPLPG